MSRTPYEKRVTGILWKEGFRTLGLRIPHRRFKHVRLYDRTDIPGWDYRYSYDNIGNRISVGGDSGDESFDYDFPAIPQL